ncbi:toxin-antitoxin system HicB family antitoxin [Luedemannella helvata]|uniref:Toxin-antitoxin system HicB family antitoxin n=1 Tax=Luedemannella helvata TaxID=349315 RepID=A0ABP4WSX8_9ACTN
MDLTTYLEGLRRDLNAAAAPGGPEVARAADLITGALEAPARLVLLEALTDAAAEITSRLDGPSVEVRLRGRDAQFVVTPPAATPPPAAPPESGADGAAPNATPPTGAPEAETGDVARITLRIPEGLKAAVERAAAAEGVSVNTWLVRAVNAVLSGPPPMPPPPGGWGPGPTPPPGWPGGPQWPGTQWPGTGRATHGPGHHVTGYAQA